MAETRAVREFAVQDDPWPVIDAWAERKGFRVIEGAGTDHRLYRKGAGFLTAPRMVDVTKAGNNVHLEGYVRANLFARASSFFILPKEMTFESGGMKGVLPRKQGRDDMNDLLQALGQPAIT